MSQLSCGDTFLEAFNDVDEQKVVLNKRSRFVIQKLVIIHVMSDKLEIVMVIEINMINIGLGGDQFECLVDSGDTSNPNHFVYDTFDEASDDITNAQAQICEKPIQHQCLFLPLLQHTIQHQHQPILLHLLQQVKPNIFIL